ncbi:MAG: PQQ-dependent sugar dehydrogenase [Nitrospirota bacterium]
MKQFLLMFVFLNLFIPLASCSQTVGGKPQNVEDTLLPDGDRIKVEVWMERLEIPWSLVFLRDGRALVSERPGRIRLMKNGKMQEKAYAEIKVARTGEAGLLGLAAHPDFPKQPYVYAYHTYEGEKGLQNRVIRLKDKGDRAVFDRVIFDGIPGGRLHDGGRIAFGPDGMLYITAGEIFQGELAQDLHSLGGKILRITPDGNIPRDNPFKDSPIFSYGHRNPQGLAWQPETKRLFESEHGPSGESGRFAHDEINIIVKGGNYGWPKVIGAPGVKSFIDPIVVWKDTTPPSGMTFYKGALLPHLTGSLFVATLRSESLVRILFDGSGHKVRAIERWFTERYGRVRDVVEGPDGALYFMTNNRDGRGNPRKGDDRIYRIVPK